ncbi:Uncharacterised protein [Burkholderia pseudomallei]|nr:Uncharacterised protein [Burkholderia pseudomallei]
MAAQRPCGIPRRAREDASGGRRLRRAVYRAVRRRPRAREGARSRADVPARAAEPGGARRHAHRQSARAGARAARRGRGPHQSRSRSGRHRAQRRAVRERRAAPLAAVDGARVPRARERPVQARAARADRAARARHRAGRQRRVALFRPVQPRVAELPGDLVRRRARGPRERRRAARQDRDRRRDRVGPLRPLRDADLGRVRAAAGRVHPCERARYADDGPRDLARVRLARVQRVAAAARRAARGLPDALAVALAAPHAEPCRARGRLERGAPLRGAAVAVARAGDLRADRRVPDLELAAPRDDDVVPALRAAAPRRRAAPAARGAARAQRIRRRRARASDGADGAGRAARAGHEALRLGQPRQACRSPSS